MIKKLLAVALCIGITAVGCACSVESAQQGYERILELVSKWTLSSDQSLQGKRTFGADNYTGSYTAQYRDFTGREMLFGGTQLQRDLGDRLTIRYTICLAGGRIRIVLTRGAERTVLLQASGDGEQTVTLASGTNCVVVEAEQAYGSVAIRCI